MKNYSLYPVDRYQTFKQFIDCISGKYGNSPALTVYSEEGQPRTRSYRELAEDVRAIAEALLEQGYAGKHLAIIGENGYETAVSILAVAYCGGVAVPIDLEQDFETMQNMVSFADAECVLFSASIAAEVQEKGLFAGKKCVVLDGGAESADSFCALLEHGRKLLASGQDRWTRVSPAPEDTAVIVYTSGTTSTSKPVMLSHLALMTNACESIMLANLSDRVFTSLPLYHVYGLTCALLNNLVGGAEICLNGNLRTMLRDLTAFRPKTVMAVPLIAEMLCKKLVEGAKSAGALNKDFTVQSLRTFFRGRPAPTAKLVAVKEAVLPGTNLLVCGGAHLSAQVSRVLLRFGIQVLQGYGITECGPLVAVNRNEFCNPESVGVVLPSYEVRVENGEIWVRGICLMTGYYRHPELTAAALQDGWFCTGDLGFVDRNGLLHITGRKKNVIVLKNGKKVSPEELETTLSSLAMVKEAMVYGLAVGSDADDVVPAVMVYPDPAETRGMAPYEILNALQREIDVINKQLPAYKQIRVINIREKEFEKTSTKKIKRGH